MKPVLDNFTPFHRDRMEIIRHERITILRAYKEKPKRKKSTTPRKKAASTRPKRKTALEAKLDIMLQNLDPATREIVQRIRDGRGTS